MLENEVEEKKLFGDMKFPMLLTDLFILFLESATAPVCIVPNYICLAIRSSAPPLQPSFVPDCRKASLIGTGTQAR